MVLEPFYDPAKSYQDNFEHGPFGLFADTSRIFPLKKPEYEFLGHKVYAPFGIPAGPLLNGKYVKAALDMGFDIPVYKTVRTRKYASHAWPNVLAVKVEGDLAPDQKLIASRDYSEPLSITNSFGVPSYDPDFWQPDMADAAQYAGAGQIVVGSFQGTLPENGSAASYIDDFALGARLVKETGVKIVEVNLSCPNEGTANLLCFDVPRARRVVEAIKNELGDVPLMIKLAYFKDEERLVQFVREVGPSVQAITSINTISAEVLDEDGEQALPGEGRLWSGVCGASVKWAGLNMVERLVRLRGELGLTFEIVGVGGAGDAAAFEQYLRVGADAVMSATAAMWNPKLGEQIRLAMAKHEVSA